MDVLLQVAALLPQLAVGPLRLLLQRQHPSRQAPGQAKRLPLRRAECHPPVEHRIVQHPTSSRIPRRANGHDLFLNGTLPRRRQQSSKCWSAGHGPTWVKWPELGGRAGILGLTAAVATHGYAVDEARRPLQVGGVVVTDAVQPDPQTGLGDLFEEGEELLVACPGREGCRWLSGPRARRAGVAGILSSGHLTQDGPYPRGHHSFC